MATTKKKAAASAEEASGGGHDPAPASHEKPRNVAAYEAALERFTAASQLFVTGQFADALPLFDAVVEAATPDEPILADRARTYASICRRKAAGPEAEGEDPDTLYHRGVVAANAGRLEEAWSLLEKAIGRRPNDASILYARASVRGLQGNAEAAAFELKKSVAIEPKFRFQAASDADFDKVRDEASFIDIIEPSNAGA